MNKQHEAFLQIIIDNKDKIEKKIEENPEFITELVQHSIESGSNILYKGFDKDKNNELKYVRKYTNGFTNRLYKTWKKPFDYFESLIELIASCTYSFTETFYEEAYKDDNLLFNALQNIQARALLISRECLTLIKNGYPDGAFSRWRTIYELSVIGKLLYDENSQDLCERYLNYYHIQEYLDEKYSRERGHQDHTDESFKILEQNYNFMINKYGKDYAKGDYGWANDVFNKKRVTFQEIKDRVDMDGLYGYYKLSSAYIHGNHKANEESLGVIPNLGKLKLVGPSNYGLSIPMQNVAISLVNISTYFFLTYSNLDVWTACSIMNKFLDKIIVESNKVQIKIEDKENKIRGIYPNVLITSFKGKNNSSSILLHSIRANLTDKLELTNSFSTSEKELKNKISKNKYKYIISFGQKPNCDHIYIELYGSKNNDKIETSFPYKKLVSFLKENNIDYSISKYAGNYLCNNIYYEGMKYIKDNSLEIEMIFIHVPSINAKFNFEKISKIISNYIEILVEKSN